MAKKPTKADKDQGQDKVAEALVFLYNLMKDRNASYGDENISHLGPKGVYVRISDKTNRLKHIVWDGGPFVPSYANNETLKDTFMDLAGYAIIGYLLAEGGWGLDTNFTSLKELED